MSRFLTAIRKYFCFAHASSATQGYALSADHLRRPLRAGLVQAQRGAMLIRWSSPSSLWRILPSALAVSAASRRLSVPLPGRRFATVVLYHAGSATTGRCVFPSLAQSLTFLMSISATSLTACSQTREMRP